MPVTEQEGVCVPHCVLLLAVGAGGVGFTVMAGVTAVFTQPVAMFVAVTVNACVMADEPVLSTEVEATAVFRPVPGDHDHVLEAVTFVPTCPAKTNFGLLEVVPVVVVPAQITAGVIKSPR